MIWLRLDTVFSEQKKGLDFHLTPFFMYGGDGETRTRDLRRDRPAF